jgi:peptidoglycan/LPS O-acetylase OafA/YrhL
MFPLNGPSWSLFFEYIGSILYALIIRRFSTKALLALVIAAGLGLGAFAIFGPYGDICAGFSLTELNLQQVFCVYVFISAELLPCFQTTENKRSILDMQ